MQYLYLHGFASSPQSTKAQYLRDRFAHHNHHLEILDLNQGDFTRLSLSRQIQQTAASFQDANTPVTLLGSSFGGLTAVWVAQQYPQVTQLVLIAPAFGFPQTWADRLGAEQLAQWQQTQYLPVYHYGDRQERQLHYDFFLDAQQYNLKQVQRCLPTLILHGLHDDVVSIEQSRAYATSHPDTRLLELDSDHSLNDKLPEIWQAVQQFLAFE
ncbi:MAG: alpha/beta fold hydrolase [Spirulina sp. SIO3F2]|nr:alpha/beta fold hydrolase [Spirulina sp. SIO3F2]